MTSQMSCFRLVDASAASSNSAWRTVLTRQTEVTTERHTGTVVLSANVRWLANCEISRKRNYYTVHKQMHCQFNLQGTRKKYYGSQSSQAVVRAFSGRFTHGWFHSRDSKK